MEIWKDYFLESNRNISDTNKDINTSKWVSNALSSPEFVFEKENRFQTITLDDEFKITIDILQEKILMLILMSQLKNMPTLLIKF